MVEAEGTARLIELPDAHGTNHRIRAKYVVPDAVDARRAWGGFDDVAIEVTPSLAIVDRLGSRRHDRGRPGPPLRGIWRD